MAVFLIAFGINCCLGKGWILVLLGFYDGMLGQGLGKCSMVLGLRLCWIGRDENRDFRRHLESCVEVEVQVVQSEQLISAEVCHGLGIG